MRIAALIIGIDGWKQYTLPLIESLRKHEPTVEIVVIDNASAVRYPFTDNVQVVRTPRLCYSKAINHAALHTDYADWFIVLSNDVLCTGSFAHLLTRPDIVIGPEERSVYNIPFLMGWCVVASREVWIATNGWDERYVVSSWEDVDFSVTARQKGFMTIPDGRLPFVHLDQRQRFDLPEFSGTHEINKSYFLRKWGPLPELH